MALYWQSKVQLKEKQMMPTNYIYLLEACKNGDPKAQLQVYKIYFRQMFNISFSLVRNADAADEVVNESFLVVFDKISSHKVSTDFLTLLTKHVQDRSIETWRKSNVPFPGFIAEKILVK